MFHEFTHIFDGNKTFFNITDKDKYDKLMSTYSEYHASQIEIMTILGYSSINMDNHKFDLSDKIYYKNELLTVNEYLLRPLADSLVILNKSRVDFIFLSKNEYYIKYCIAERSMLYYLGKYNICQSYGKQSPHYFFHEFDEFQEDVKIIYNSLINKDLDDFLKCINDFMKHYLEYFLMPLK